MIISVKASVVNIIDSVLYSYEQYGHHLFTIALISIKFSTYLGSNVTIPRAKFPKPRFKNGYKIKKNRFAYNSWTQCIIFKVDVKRCLQKTLARLCS